MRKNKKMSQLTLAQQIHNIGCNLEDIDGTVESLIEKMASRDAELRDLNEKVGCVLDLMKVRQSDYRNESTRVDVLIAIADSLSELVPKKPKS